MVDNSALGVAAAQSRAWIATLLVDANLSRSAVGVEDAFWFTTLAGVTEIFRKTLTYSRTILVTTDGISTTRRWFARCPDRSLRRF